MYVFLNNVQDSFFFFFFFFGCACGMWKFPGQGLNLCHGSDPGFCNDSARNLTHCATRELCKILLFFFFLFEATCDIWKFLDQGQNWSCSCWPMAQPLQHQHWIQVTSLTYGVWQCQILNTLSKTRNQTCILMETTSYSKP